MCGQSQFAQIYAGGVKTFNAMCDRQALDTSEGMNGMARSRRGHDGDALILLEHLLKHGKSAAPRSWTSG